LKYYNNIEDIDITDTFCVKLDNLIYTKQELFEILSKSLHLPDYFGFNWDALHECLRDFNWIEVHTIVIIHTIIPYLTNDEFKIYIEILYDSVADWKEGEEHSLKVYFPLEFKEKIESIISESKRENRLIYS
jgi:RNAse (barnase) inhibitor barstar